MRDEKEERSKQGQTNNKAKQHMYAVRNSTDHSVCPHAGLEEGRHEHVHTQCMPDVHVVLLYVHVCTCHVHVCTCTCSMCMFSNGWQEWVEEGEVLMYM